MAVYQGIQEKKIRAPALNPKPSVKTRWNSANQIMGDFCETFEILLAKGGDDYDLLNKTEKDLGNLTCFTYTSQEKMILCQFEAAAAPAKSFSKFTQDKRDSWSYVLFEARVAIQTSRKPTFDMVQGMLFIHRFFSISLLFRLM